MSDQWDIEDYALYIAIPILVALTILVSAGVGSSVAEEKMREEAVQVGVGEWYINSDGEKAFRWKVKEK